jgi:hypothetical protein
MAPHTVYKVGLSRWDRLWLELLHAAYFEAGGMDNAAQPAEAGAANLAGAANGF